MSAAGFIHGRLLLPLYEGCVKGRRTYRYWRELDRSQWLSKHALEELQFQRLRRLLDHAYSRSAYYRNEWDRLGIHPRDVQAPGDFQRWPILTRESIRVHRAAMRTTPRLISKSTGGSSGEPLHFDLDHDSNDRRTAAWHRGYGWAHAAPGTRQLYLWGVPPGHRSGASRLKDRLYQALYRRHVVSCFELTPGFERTFLRTLDRDRPDSIVAYVNPLYEVARRLEETGAAPHFRPRSIVVGAEKLHSFQREVIERVFGAPVFETYGSREFMLIGAECEHHSGLHLTAENLLVEIVNPEGQPTPEGQEGDLIVTDLTNRGMPFIRYATGDRAIAGLTCCPCGRGLPLLRKVVGRQLDLIRGAGGVIVPGEFFPHLIKDFPAVRRFQVVQEADGRIRLLLVTHAMASTDRTRLERIIRDTVDPHTQFEDVTDIPLSRAGKHRVVVNRRAA